MSDKNISTMDLKQLRNEVQLLRDELAITKRKYEDILYNLDDANFSDRFVKEKDNMKTAITVTAEGIKTLVTKDEFESEMMETASLIATKVSNTELGKYSTTAQTADAISTVVSKNISAYYESELMPTKYATNEEKSMLCLYDDIYWYYSDFDEIWKEYPADGLKTMFRQTADKFELTGDVTISGNLLTQGEIKGLTVGTAQNKFGDGVWLNSEESSLDIIYMNNVVGRWSRSDAPSIGSSIYPVGGACLNISNATATGKWDFSSCGGITWGNNAPVAVFG